MDSVGMFSGTVGIVIFIFLLITAILWFLMPFAVFGIKNRLDEHIKEQKVTNNLLAEIAAGSQSGSVNSGSEASSSS